MTSTGNGRKNFYLASGPLTSGGSRLHSTDFSGIQTLLVWFLQLCGIGKYKNTDTGHFGLNNLQWINTLAFVALGYISTNYLQLVAQSCFTSAVSYLILGTYVTCLEHVFSQPQVLTLILSVDKLVYQL